MIKSQASINENSQKLYSYFVNFAVKLGKVRFSAINRPHQDELAKYVWGFLLKFG